VLCKKNGEALSPNTVSREWIRFASRHGLASVKFHALRHTHASQLIAAGMDVITISRRLGHASPTVTLGVYGHRFQNKDAQAAQIVSLRHRDLNGEYRGANSVPNFPFVHACDRLSH
jgi:integrase